MKKEKKSRSSKAKASREEKKASAKKSSKSSKKRSSKKKDKKGKSSSSSSSTNTSTSTSKANSESYACPPHDYTDRCSKFRKDSEKWLKSAKNTSSIEVVSVDPQDCSITFQFTEEECEFVVHLPKEDDDLFRVTSDHLDPSFGEKSTECAMAETRIQSILRIVTEQFQAISEEDFSSGFGDSFEYSDDDVFGMAMEDVDPSSSKAGAGGGEAGADDGPEIDETAFSFPSEYEPGAVQSILKEYREILREGPESLGFEVSPVGENICQWSVKLYGIPKDSALWKDMKKLKIDHIVMHVTFPPTYPFAPPFFRVVNPRFKFRTGHVTIGGAICTMLLSNEGWTASYRISNVLVDIRAMFTAGDGRLDMKNRSEYTEYEAMTAFRRLLSTHGWTHWKK